MEYQANEPLNIQLSQLADQYLGILHHQDESPERNLREAAPHRDLRLIAVVTEFKNSIDQLRKKRRFSTNDFAIVSSFYRDVRVFAVTRGLLDLFRVAFREENSAKRQMYRTTGRRRDHVVACVYAFWGITSRYGTSLMQWIVAGLVLIAAFTILILTHSFGANNWIESFLLSVETFTQCAYDVKGSHFMLRADLLVERLLGMAYFVFGFSLLIPRFSMELSRTTPTVTRKPAVDHAKQIDNKINCACALSIDSATNATRAGKFGSDESPTT